MGLCGALLARSTRNPVCQSCLSGNTQLRKQTVVEPSNCGIHCNSLALWESGGTSTTIIGTLPALVRNTIAGLIHLVYRMAKRGSPPGPHTSGC